MRSLSPFLGFVYVLLLVEWSTNHAVATTVSRKAPAEGLEESAWEERKRALTKFSRKEKGARGLKATKNNIFMQADTHNEDNTKLGGTQDADILVEGEKSGITQSVAIEREEARSGQNKGGAKTAGIAAKAKTGDIQESTSGLREETTTLEPTSMAAKQAKGDIALATNQTSLATNQTLSPGRVGFLDVLFQAGLLTAAALVGAGGTAAMLCATGSICAAPSTAPSAQPNTAPPTIAATTAVPSFYPSAVGSVVISLTSTMSLTFWSLLVNDFTAAEYVELDIIMDRFYSDGFRASALAADFTSYVTFAIGRTYNANAAPHVVVDFEAFSIFTPGSTATNTQVAGIMSGLDYEAFITNYLQAGTFGQLWAVNQAVFAETTSATNPIIASPASQDENIPHDATKEAEEHVDNSSVNPSGSPSSPTPSASPSTLAPSASPSLAITTGPTAAPSMSSTVSVGEDPGPGPAPSLPIPGPSPPPGSTREDSSHNSGTGPSGAPSEPTSSKDDGDHFAFTSTDPDDGVELFNLSVHEEMVGFGTGPDDDKLGSNTDNAATNLPTAAPVPTPPLSTAGPTGDAFNSVSNPSSYPLGTAGEALVGSTGSTSAPSLSISGPSLSPENSSSSSTAESTGEISRSASNPSSSHLGTTLARSSSTLRPTLLPENSADQFGQSSALLRGSKADSTSSKDGGHFAFSTGPDNGVEPLDFSSHEEMFGLDRTSDEKLGSAKDPHARLLTFAQSQTTSHGHSATPTSGPLSEQVQGPSGVSNGLRNLRTRRIRNRTRRAKRHKNIRTNKRGLKATTQRDGHTVIPS